MALPGSSDPHSIANQRRPVRFAQGQAEGAGWMLECRDMWDAADEDGGLYFEFFQTTLEARREVEAILAKPNEVRLLGIYDLTRPLEPQGAGLSAQQFLVLTQDGQGFIRGKGD